ncbi:helix-turn-helix transcriptional regulator [Deferribacterales bacterium Es71-Z0220]|jgi:transcriptional regulator with XRE-family HTH domain|uniref:helix-turn-helix domain-containing protein n=1 Tax=Deferrivibrio essentukiensis TaxID=2880922 RepID=UPI001F612011|nr:helix-turn-helix transcriptional regulator [Deferrivibrio essentukiensis]MCB4205546.1 helix-turn-helix transcriptional regulator [Deferrivibrio essentukiensis]
MKPFELGLFIKEKRKEKKIKQEDLAKYAGISRQTLSKLEQGNLASVSIKALILILDKLDLEIHLTPKKHILPSLDEDFDL